MILVSTRCVTSVGLYLATWRTHCGDSAVFMIADDRNTSWVADAG